MTQFKVGDIVRNASFDGSQCRPGCPHCINWTGPITKIEGGLIFYRRTGRGTEPREGCDNVSCFVLASPSVEDPLEENKRLKDRVDELEAGLREVAIMHQDDRPGIGEPSGDFDWRLRSEAQERIARALLQKVDKEANHD